MNRSKSRSNRSKITFVRGQSYRNGADFNESTSLLHISARVGSGPSANDSMPSDNNDETGTLIDAANDVISSAGIERLRIRNGFKINPHPSVLKSKYCKAKPVDVKMPTYPGKAFTDSTNDQQTNIASSVELNESVETSSLTPNSSTELRSSINEKGGAELPPFEESIVEGFSIMAFSTSSDIELYARLTDAIEATLDQQSGSVSASLNCIPGRQRRGILRHPTSRGKKSALHASAVAIVAANETDALIKETSCLTKHDDTKEDSGRLRPLHIDTAPTSSTRTCDRKSSLDVSSRPKESEQNGFLISNSKDCFAPSDDKSFLVLSSNNIIMDSTETTGSSAASKRDPFSIAALTAVEERKEAPSTMKAPMEHRQPQAHSRQLLQPSYTRLNGHPLTPAQCLDRLSNRGTDLTWNREDAEGTKVAEEELRQLTHLLFTNRVFTQQVARLPQIMAFYHQQLQQQKHQRSIPPTSFPSAPTAQSFASALTSQQNSIATKVSSASLTNVVFSPPEHPSLPFTPPVATSVPSSGATNTTTYSSVAYFPTPVNSVFATSTAPIHPKTSADFFNLTSIASVMRPPAPRFLGQVHSTPTGQIYPSLSSKVSMSLPTAPHLAAHHLFIPNSLHLPTLWSRHQSPNLQSPVADFSYLMTPTPHRPPAPPSINPSHTLKKAAADAVDLTSATIGGRGGGSSKQSSCSRPSTSQTHADSLNLWPHQRSPVAIVPLIQHPQSLTPSDRRLQQLPNFHDLFHTEGVFWNSGATAHLRICYHIMRNKAHGLKPVNPSNPWWYIEPNSLLLQPKPREHLPPASQMPRFLNYERFIRLALESCSSAKGTVPLLPSNPIAVHLTRSPPAHMAALEMSSVGKPLQHQEIPRIIDSATMSKFLQQRQQETDLMTSLKRRRMMLESETLVSPLPMQSHSQLLPPPHYQNGGMQMALSLPFPQLHFRHPL